MPAHGVVEAVDVVSDDLEGICVRGRNEAIGQGLGLDWTVLKKLSATALSQQSPFRLMLATRPKRLSSAL